MANAILKLRKYTEMKIKKIEKNSEKLTIQCIVGQYSTVGESLVVLFHGRLGPAHRSMGQPTAYIVLPLEGVPSY